MMGTLLVVPTEAKTGKFPPSWEGVPCGGTVRVLQIDRKRKLEKIKKKIVEKEKGGRGNGGAGHETKDRNEKSSNSK